MLAGARHSSDQLGFWSHSKSAVVCRCRKCLPRPDWPPGAANHRHHGCLSLGLAGGPAATVAGMGTVQQAFQHPRAPFGPGAGQLASSVATVGGGWEDRVGLVSPPPSTARWLRLLGESRQAYQLIPSISASSIQLDQPWPRGTAARPPAPG